MFQTTGAGAAGPGVSYMAHICISEPSSLCWVSSLPQDMWGAVFAVAVLYQTSECFCLCCGIGKEGNSMGTLGAWAV